MKEAALLGLRNLFQLLVIKGMVTSAFLGLGVVPQAKSCSGRACPSSNDRTCVPVLWSSACQLGDFSVHKDDSHCRGLFQFTDHHHSSFFYTCNYTLDPVHLKKCSLLKSNTYLVHRPLSLALPVLCNSPVKKRVYSHVPYNDVFVNDRPHMP